MAHSNTHRLRAELSRLLKEEKERVKSETGIESYRPSTQSSLRYKNRMSRFPVSYKRYETIYKQTYGIKPLRVTRKHRVRSLSPMRFRKSHRRMSANHAKHSQKNWWKQSLN